MPKARRPSWASGRAAQLVAMILRTGRVHVRSLNMRMCIYSQMLAASTLCSHDPDMATVASAVSTGSGVAPAKKSVNIAAIAGAVSTRLARRSPGFLSERWQRRKQCFLRHASIRRGVRTETHLRICGKVCKDRLRACAHAD